MNVPLLRFTHKNGRSDSLKISKKYKLFSIIASVFSNRVQLISPVSLSALSIFRLIKRILGLIKLIPLRVLRLVKSNPSRLNESRLKSVAHNHRHTIEQRYLGD
jgi:hypothetical protein